MVIAANLHEIYTYTWHNWSIPSISLLMAMYKHHEEILKQLILAGLQLVMAWVISRWRHWSSLDAYLGRGEFNHQGSSYIMYHAQLSHFIKKIYKNMHCTHHPWQECSVALCSLTKGWLWVQKMRLKSKEIIAMTHRWFDRYSGREFPS